LAKSRTDRIDRQHYLVTFVLYVVLFTFVCLIVCF
jgi:hypothetical protein